MNVSINIKFVNIDTIAKYKIHVICFVWAFSTIFVIIMKITSSKRNAAATIMVYSVIILWEKITPIITAIAIKYPQYWILG